MATAVSLAALSDGTHGFGRVRMWGTLGYFAAVVSFPWLSVQLAGSAGNERLIWLFAFAALFATPAAVLVMRLPPVEALGLRARPGEFRRVLAHLPVRRLIFFAFFSNLAMQGPINLFPVLLASRGGTVEDLRSAWILMLALEVPLVGFAGATLARLGPRGLLLMGLLGEGLRWTATAFVPSLGATIGLQLFHGLSAMGILIGIPLYLELSIPARLRSTGQTLIAACGLGLGSIVSIAGGGWLYDQGGAFAPFLGGGLVALSLAAALFFVLPAPCRPEEEGSVQGT
jgi:PPP family 3-phenylpropionic acid transporter